MSTFELNACSSDNHRCTEECIIAQKIFDQCRIQKCLTPCILGPARAACTGSACSDFYHEGEIIVPPCNAASVAIKDMKLCKIIIMSKKLNPFRSGFWDIEVKFVFVYTLVFKACDGDEICCIKASNSYSKKVTLYGGEEGNVVVSSDLFSCSDLLESGPFVTVEGKAVGLASELKYPCMPSCGCGCDCNTNCGCGCGCDCNTNCGCGCGCDCNTNCGCGCENNCMESNQLSNGSAISVDVTIGLFAVIKLFRPVNIIVESHGFCVPEESNGTSPTGNPCDFFDCLEFPMNLFVPGLTAGPTFKGNCNKNDDCESKKNDDCCCKKNNDCGCRR